MKQTSARRATERTFRSLGFLEVLFLVQTCQVGIGLFNLPRIVVEEAGHDGWMCVIFTGIVTQISVLVIVLLTKRFPDLDLYGIFNRLFGTWIGRLLGALFCLYCLMIAALVGRGYIEVLQLWLFPTTSTNVFYLLLLIPCFYAATAGARVLGRFGILTFFATAWMLLLLLAPAKEVTVEYYLPFFDTSAWNFVRGSWKVTTSCVGFELVLVYHTFVKPKVNLLRASSIGIWITVVVYVLVTLISIGFYSPGQIMRIISPTLHMYQVVELPLIERLEHIGISTWSFLVANTVATYIWAAGRFVYSFGKWDEPRSVLIFFPLMFLIGLWGKDVFILMKLVTWIGGAGGAVSLFLPLLLLLFAIVMRKRGSKPAPPEEELPEVSAS